MTSAWSITESVRPPRAVFTDFPLGNTAGPPHRSDVQLDIARQALSLIATDSEPGTILPLSHEWGEPWKEEARELVDHRTERFETPQYQEVKDREAAIARHGEQVATGEASSRWGQSPWD